MELELLLYFDCGSYNYIQNVFYSTFGVAPFENVIQNEVVKSGLNVKGPMNYNFYPNSSIDKIYKKLMQIKLFFLKSVLLFKF